MKQNDLSILRHSAAHLLGHAVSELFPGTLLTIGPATEDGFFYDFLPLTHFKEEDLINIAARMNDLADKNLKLEHKEISKEEARQLFKNNPFKLELIDQIPGDTVGLATQGDFYDLCRGGHVASTGLLKNFKLLGISGSYWRADRSKQALQRISGTAFFTAQELENYEKQKEEALLNDHRRIGKQLDLFSFQDEGPGFPFYHPKGKKVMNLLIDYMRFLHNQYNYQEVATPALLSDALWKQSGHYSYYKDKMYFCHVDNQNYALKPMNCPGAILIYKNRPHSYRELPLKLAEFGHVHRYELSGVMHGLLRARAFTQDDAHIFCTIDQVEQEITTILAIVFKMLKQTGFEKINIALSTKPEDAMGSNEIWAQAIQALKNALENQKITYTIQEGEGAFYGPKIEIGIEDSMGRSWQCGTIQVDFLQPENFDLFYISSQGTKERPVIIHQALYGSLERFFAILLEHTKGNLPLWLAPIQGRILPITDAHQPYAQKIFDALKREGMRIEIDTSTDPLSGKIKDAQQNKIPWMLIVGAKEQENNTITLRHHNGKQEILSLEALIKKFCALNEFFS
ncbi:MAG: threonine--tRNA ligase [Candidatus Babeliaceae bacterium]